MGLKDCFGLLEQEEWNIPSKETLDNIIKELEVKLYEQKMKDLYLEKEKTMQIVPEWLRKNVG